MLIEPDFGAQFRSENRNSGTTIIEEQVFMLIEKTFEDGQVNMVSVETCAVRSQVTMACFQHNAYGIAQKIEQV